MLQVADGLAFVHAKDIVHRDLKPGNIHIQPNGRAKIMDFGLVRLGDSNMTRAGMVMGSPSYMAPEQMRGQRADVRSDVFSLGAVYWELLVGRRAFEGKGIHQILLAVLSHEPKPVNELVPEVPPRLGEIVTRALCKDPNARYQNAGELRDALKSLTRQGA
jgi:serine/threonine-protein kinase